MRHIPSSVHLFYPSRYAFLITLSAIISTVTLVSGKTFSAELSSDHATKVQVAESSVQPASANSYAGNWVLREVVGDTLEQQVRSLVRRKLQRWQPDAADVASAQGDLELKRRAIESIVKQDLERLIPAFLLTELQSPGLTILVKPTEFSLSVHDQAHSPTKDQTNNQVRRLLYFDGRPSSLSLKDFQQGKNSNVSTSGWEKNKFIAETTTWHGTRIVEKFSVDSKHAKLFIDYSISHQNFASPVTFRRIYHKVN